MKSKKGEMGIGTLIIFIALLLVAAVAAGVLIQTSGSLQEKALTTGSQAEGQIATNVRVIEVSATDGSNGNLEYLQQIVKLSPGSDAIKLSQTLLTMNTYDATATLQYRGTSGVHEDNMTDGYYTGATNETLSAIVGVATEINLAEDYDGDATIDTATLTANAYLNFTFSGGTSLLVNDFNCSGAEHSVAGTYTVSGSSEVSSLIVTGDCGGNDTTNATIAVELKDSGVGYFTVEYLQRGTNPVDGNLQTGDVIKIYYEAPRSLQEDEEIRLNFIPKIGTPTLTQFITPEVISTQRVYLYP